MSWDKKFQFNPTFENLAQLRAGAFYTAFSGANNAGKSAILKALWARSNTNETAFLPVSRFLHDVRLRREMGMHPIRQDPAQVLSVPENIDMIPLDVPDMVRTFTNDQRSALFELISELLGVRFEIVQTIPDNQLSDWVLLADGDPVSALSTGTRLLFSLLVVCSNRAFNCVFIDEPELGFNPAMQASIANILCTPDRRRSLFPHLQSVIVATHSHLFLDRIDFRNNFRVERKGRSITAKPVSSIHDLQHLQLNLLGNKLEGLFLPNAIVFVEGKTDYPYIRRAIDTLLPESNIIVEPTQGDAKGALSKFSRPLGGLQKTPYASRTFVVFDSVMSPDQKQGVVKLGVPSDNVIGWAENGIEYLYPIDILSKIYGQALRNLKEDLRIDDDRVSVGTILYTKAQLSDLVIAQLNERTQYPQELVDKLLNPLKRALGSE